jgi:hypothetical protein
VPRRASLPGADELFRRTTSEKPRQSRPEPQEVDKATKLQVAPAEVSGDRKAPKHEEKVTFYCTPENLMQLERARLSLRSEHGVGADRGRIVRAALDYVLEDFEARGDDSILLRQLDR